MKLYYSINYETELSKDYKFIRKLLNMPQNIFSELIGTSSKTIQRIENMSKISKKTLKKPLMQFQIYFLISNLYM